MPSSADALFLEGFPFSTEPRFSASKAGEIKARSKTTRNIMKGFCRFQMPSEVPQSRAKEDAQDNQGGGGGGRMLFLGEIRRKQR